MASSIDTTKPTAVRAFTADVRQNFTYAKSEIEALQGRADALETVTTGLGTAAYQPTTAFATAAQGATADSATQPGDNLSTLTNDAGYVDAAGALAAAPAETATTIGAIVSGATPKAAPVDADIFPLSNSEAGGVLSGVTFANVKAAFTAFFSATYATIASVALKANIASPNLTGTPTAPTADAGNNSTQIANTAYVQSELASTQHNGLAGLDAGETGYYGHLTSAQQVDVAALSALDGQAATVTPADTALLPLWVSGVYEEFSISAFKTWLASLAATWANKTLTSPALTNPTITGNVTNGAGTIGVAAVLGDDPPDSPQFQHLGRLAFADYVATPLGIGTGISGGTGTYCKADAVIEGGVKRISILIDLTGLNSGDTAGDIIGVNGTANPCYLIRVPTMVNLGVKMTCLETPAGGDTDIDLYSAIEGTGVEDGAVASLTETQIINGGAQTQGTVSYQIADIPANSYLYLVGQGTSNATYTAGRFLIEILGA